MKGRVLALVGILALTGSAAAQSVDLAITAAPANATLTAGESKDLSFDVNLRVEGYDCAQSVDLPVNLTSSVVTQGSAPPNASTNASQAALTFTVPAGSHHEAPAGNQSGPYNETKSATVTVSTQGGVRSNYTVDLEAQAIFNGTSTTSCVPNQFPSAQSDPSTVPIRILADEPPKEETADTRNGSGSELSGPAGNGTGAGNASGSPPGTASENGTPLAWPAVPLAAGLAALVLRRRR